VEDFLFQRGLTLSAEKTTTTHIDKGFDFLGQTIRKYKSKLIIKPSGKSVNNILRRSKDLIRKNRANTQEEVIKVLSPQIRGWAYYHRGSCARKAYEKVDHQIFQSLWQWSKRRHPNKGTRWIKEKYFKRKENQNWCFATTTKKKNTIEWQELFRATSIPIQRHIKIRANSNPFDKEWSAYFAERQSSNYTTRNNYRLELECI